MIALYAAGEIVEKKLGKKFFLAIYTLSGLAAGIMSVWHHTRFEIPYYGLGASGAVYGIIGCMIAYMVISGIDKDNAKGLIIRIACAMILFFMAGSGADGDVDYMSHMGGFICGFFGTGIWLLAGSIISGKKKNVR